MRNKPVFRSKLVSVHNRYSIDTIDSARRMFSRPPSGEGKRGNSLSFFLSKNFERALELGQDPLTQVRTGIGTIAPDFFDGMEDRKQARNDLTSGFIVKHIGGVYPDDEYATDCINNDRTFSALNGFAPVKSRFYIGFRGSLDTLTIK